MVITRSWKSIGPGTIFGPSEIIEDPFPFVGILSNGFFKQRTEEGNPEYWTLGNPTALRGEGNHWDVQNKPRPAPGIELDREGALFLRQAIAMEPKTIIE